MIMSRQLMVALTATVIAFSTLYTPQPLLPLLADEFAVGLAEVVVDVVDEDVTVLLPEDELKPFLGPDVEDLDQLVPL